jgi:hypothetical protein
MTTTTLYEKLDALEELRRLIRREFSREHDVLTALEELISYRETFERERAKAYPEVRRR